MTWRASGRGRVAAGAVLHEQHGRPRSAGGRPARRRRTRRRCRSGRRARPAGSRQPRARRAVGLGGVLELGGAGLARHAHAGDRGRAAGADLHDGLHEAARRVRAVERAQDALAGRAARPARSVSDVRMPPSAIVAATHAICSAVACTLPWPIADEPTASSSPISLGMRESCSSRRRGCRRSWLKPNASAVCTSRSGPRRAPSGAKTELQECAKDSRSEPPQDSPLAFSSSTPSSVAAVCTG